MKRIAVTGAILENPEQAQAPFNAVVAEFKGIVKGKGAHGAAAAGARCVRHHLAGSPHGQAGVLPDVQVKTFPKGVLIPRMVREGI